MAVFEATPPAMANFFIPVSSRAIIALLTKVSTTDFWKDAATSAGLISSPFIFDKLSWLSTADLSPLKLKS